VLAGVAVVLVVAVGVSAHCQIPCGIYNDPARFTLMAEHIDTIEKSMKKIDALSKEEKPKYNQLVRWVGNKETHADELSEIITYYFMAQRVKPADTGNADAHKKYVHQLTLLHRMLVHAMKAKQTTDPNHVATLRKHLKDFKASYLGDGGKK
jgi:nickel superoxide dismutase